jgi:hypothetical protein
MVALRATLARVDEATRGGLDRRLVFENAHQNRIAAYPVNCLVG